MVARHGHMNAVNLIIAVNVVQKLNIKPIKKKVKHKRIRIPRLACSKDPQYPTQTKAKPNNL